MRLDEPFPKFWRIMFWLGLAAVAVCLALVAIHQAGEIPQCFERAMT